jgi:translocation and assembly module TamA
MRALYSRFVLLTGALVLCAAAVHAADPQGYTVELAPTGDAAMDSTLKGSSELQSLRTAASIGPFGLIARARGDVERLKTVLESYGYYQSSVSIKIEGLALNDPTLGEAVNALPKGRNARVAIAFTLGPLYHLGRIDIDGSVPDSARAELGLKSGAPAVASEVLAGGARLLAALQQQGYAFAKVDPPVAYEAANAPVLDVTFPVATGARVKIGQILIVGLRRVHEAFVRRRLLLHSGVQYDSTDVEKARRDLLTLGVFATVGVQLGKAVDASGGVPVTFTVTERKRHGVTINAGYSSDLGGSGGSTWTDRNVFGNAETLTLAASVINLGGSATTGLGYDTSAKLVLPDFGHRDQSLQFAVDAVKQYLTAYDQTAFKASVILSRRLSSIWTVSAGVAAADDHVLQPGAPQHDATLIRCNALSTAAANGTAAANYAFFCDSTQIYTLLGLPLTLGLDTTHLANPLDDPLHGIRAALSVEPTRSFGTPNATYVISQIKVAGYFDLHGMGLTEPGRSVIAARALAGVAQGAGEFSLPPDQRFYGGGSETIRGYRFQAVGPQFPNGNPIGGTAIAAGGVELRQRFGTDYGAAVFMDGGQVSSSLKPLPTDFYVGLGAGLRYYTPIGPVRFDLAFPTRRYTVDGDRFEVYIGLGQAF